MPAIDRDLAGDQQGSPVVAIIDDLEQIAALLGIERFRPPIIDDQQAGAFERAHQARKSASSTTADWRSRASRRRRASRLFSRLVASRSTSSPNQSSRLSSPASGAFCSSMKPSAKLREAEIARAGHAG